MCNEKLKIIDPSFDDADSIVLFGAGRNCDTFINNLKNDVSVFAFIDNDPGKHGTEVLGIKVYPLDEVKKFSKKYKIIINSETYYHEMAAQLRKFGLVENVDFTSILKFQAVWYWNNKRKVVLFQTSSYINTECTLNCKYCRPLMPLHKKKFHYDFETLKKDYDLYFGIVDEVRIFHVCGGETLLHPQLDEILGYLAGKYGEKITSFRVSTNGTVTLDEKTLKCLSKYKIFMVISDYTEVTDTKKSQDSLIKQLKEYEIPFEVYYDMKWSNIKFPYELMNYDDSYLKKHMSYCSTQSKCINDEKLFYCGTTWAAEKGGLFKNRESDYLELKTINSDCNIDKKRFLEYYLGEFGDGYLLLCKYCAGESYDNPCVTKAAEQLKRSEIPAIRDQAMQRIKNLNAKAD